MKSRIVIRTLTDTCSILLPGNEDETRNFATEQRKEFGPKEIHNFLKAKPFPPDYVQGNPIIESYKEYLNTEQKNNSLPFYLRTETPTENIKKLRSERPHLKFLSRVEPLNETLVELDRQKLLKSTYQLEYFAKNLGGHGSTGEEKTIEVVLPNDYPVPETTQKKSYRDPRHFRTGNLVSRHGKYAGPPDNLGFNDKEREILRVRTGDSEYQEIVGRAGRRIMREKIHGTPMPIEPPEEHVKNPDSARSLCSEILMSASKRHVLSQII